MKKVIQHYDNRKHKISISSAIVGFTILVFAFTAPSTIEDVFFAGSQDGESGTFEGPDRCASCHGGYDINVEPSFNWSGSMMAQAARDPLYEACMTICNQDVPDVGDLCIRCHSPEGWLGGRSIPTDGSALTAADKEGIHCDFCHRLVKPTEIGINPYPLDQVYTDNTYSTDQAYLMSIDSLPPLSGNGMYIVDSDGTQRGPFADPGAKHQFHYSPFHSESAICGTCHDVSNPVYDRQADGSYAPNEFGYSAPSYNTYDLFPVERTYSEWLVSEYNTPAGVYAPGLGGNKDNVSTCQDCHMRDLSGVAANKASAVYRDDLPHHDLTGGNTLVPGMIKELFPGDVNAAALDSAIVRARHMLKLAATVDLNVTDMGDHLTALVRVTNETGHKLPSGYPEGRRIWLNIIAKDISGVIVYESGHYDFSTGLLSHDTDVKIYEIKPGLDNAMATLTGIPEGPTFHFVLNNKIFSDNRIPPRGFTNAAFENIQSPPVNYTYADGQYWDETQFILPINTDSVEVILYYQTISKEYVEFLRDENISNETGNILYDLWNTHGKSAPEVMNFIAAKVEHDTDGDGISDDIDNCPDIANINQIDADGDGAGAECDCDDSDNAITLGETYFADTDSDGYGDAGSAVVACIMPEGYVSNSDDCDDTDTHVYPGASALPDGKDNDCDGIVDKVAQTIDFTIIGDQLEDVASLTLEAISSSGLPVSFLLEAGNVELVSNILTIYGAGIVTIVANQTGDDGYLSADPASQSFCVNPLKPVISVVSVNNQQVLKSSAITGNQWYFDGLSIPEEINDTLIPTESGNYAVHVGIEQCISEMSDELYIELTGIEENLRGEIVVYPNPSIGLVFFKLPEQLLNKSLKLTVLDISGRYILSLVNLEETMGEVMLDMGYFEPGVYNYLIIEDKSGGVYRGQIILR